jgi:hypothetical protein
MTPDLEKRDFEGVVVRRDADGYGLVEFQNLTGLSSALGVFTREVLQNPAIDSACKIGAHVVGRAEITNGFAKILNLIPIGR